MRRLFLLMVFLLTGVASTAATGFAAEDGLPAALRAAHTHHPAIRGQLAELAAQGYSVKSAESDRYPTLSTELQALEADEEVGTLVVRQPLYAFGKISFPIEKARQQLEAERLVLLQLQRELMEEVTAVYAQFQGIRAQLAVAEENIEEHRKLFQRIENRRAGQLASEADVQLARSRLIQAEAQREEIAAELQVAEDELLSLTQVVVGSETPVDPALTILPDSETLRRQIMAQHPDIRYKEKLIDVAETAVSIQKVSSMPTLYAEAEWDFWDYTTENEARVGLTFEASLDGGGLAISSRVKAATSQVEAARYDLRSTRNDVTLRIRSLLTNLQLQSRLQASQEAAVAAVRQTRDSYLRQYDTSRKSWLEVLNMQSELTEQRLELVQVESSRRVLGLRLAVLAGRLDDAAGIEPIPE